MKLAAAADHLRALADSSHPLAAGAIRDAQLRTALKTVIEHCDSDISYQTERDELELVAAELHDLLDRAADVLDAYPGPFEPDGSWDVFTLARQARDAIDLPPSALGERLLAELQAARAWRHAVHAMTAACDQDDPEAVTQWAAMLRLAEETWQQATRPAGPEDCQARPRGHPREPITAGHGAVAPSHPAGAGLAPGRRRHRRAHGLGPRRVGRAGAAPLGRGERRRDAGRARALPAGRPGRPPRSSAPRFGPATASRTAPLSLDQSERPDR